MVNLIFCILLIIGIVYGVATNQGNEILNVLLSSPKESFVLFIDLNMKIMQQIRIYLSLILLLQVIHLIAVKN